MIIRILAIILVLSFFPNFTLCAGQENLVQENKLLKEELSLSQKSTLYVVFNVTERIIQIKARGLILREFPIQHIKLWGSSLPLKSLTLVKKTTLIKPSRSKISPGDNKDSGDFDLDALELDDMPARYNLVLDKRVFVSVKPAGGFFSKAVNIISSLNHFITRPVVTLWYAAWGKQYSAVDLYLEKQDAKALYWSFSEGTKSLLYP